MSKKEFEAIAAAIRRLVSECTYNSTGDRHAPYIRDAKVEAIRQTVIRISEVAIESNPRFDVKKFEEACGFPNP